MRLIDADKLDMSVKVDGDRTLSPIAQLIAQTIIENAQTIESDEDCIGRKVVLDLVEDMTDQFGVEHRVITEGVISMLPPVTPKPKTDVLDKIRSEIKEVQTYKMFEGEDTVYVERKDVLAIIDRYTKDGE